MKASYENSWQTYARKLAVLAGLSILALTLWAISPPILKAQSDCSNPYTVQPGDYLAAIALRFDTSVEVLISLNPSLARNPNLIFPDQVLCLPSEGPEVNTLNIVAEVTYTYAPTPTNPLMVGPPQTASTPIRKLNQRVVYSLEQGTESDIALGSEQMKGKIDEKLQMNTAPLLVAVDNKVISDPNHEPGSYYLVAIGAQNEPLLQRLGFLDDEITVNIDTPGICNPTPLADAFGGQVQDAEGTITVEGANGYRHVFGLSDLHVVQDWAHFQQCYEPNRTLFALFPSTTGEQDKFHLILLTTDPRNPTPGEQEYNSSYYPSQPPWWLSGFRFWW
jgi:LysM repeat protein